jgi:hypothetical protein
VFNPTRDQARQFLIDAWAKRRQRLPATPMETLADALTREWTPEQGETNPFLHLSMHLAIEEQLSIDQPPGILAAFNLLQSRRGDRHDALHAVLECLGEMLWRAQRSKLPPDGDAYIDCVRRKAG